MTNVIATIPILNGLDPASRARLAEHAERRVLGERELLFREGDPARSFCFVARGRLKLVKTLDHGRDQILEICGPGQMLCTAAVCTETSFCCSSVSMEHNTEVVLIPRDEVLSSFEASQPMGAALLTEIASRGKALCQRIGELGAGQVEQRLAKLLLKLADREGVPSNGSIRIPIALTRQDLADLCGTTVETAIRIMSRWRRGDIVQTAERGLVIRDPAALKEICRHPARRTSA
jgi:CRP/FNR family transcriptional regulator